MSKKKDLEENIFLMELGRDRYVKLGNSATGIVATTVGKKLTVEI